MSTYIRSQTEDAKVLKLIVSQFKKTDAVNQIPKATYSAYPNLTTSDDLTAAKATLLAEFNRILNIAVTATAGTITITSDGFFRTAHYQSYPAHTPTFSISGVIPNILFQYFGISNSNVIGKTFTNTPVQYAFNAAMGTTYYKNLWNVWNKVTAKLTQLQKASQITATIAAAKAAYASGQFTNTYFAAYKANMTSDGSVAMAVEADRVYDRSGVLFFETLDSNGNITGENASYWPTSEIYADAFLANFSSSNFDAMMQASTGWWILGTPHDAYLTPQLLDSPNYCLQQLLDYLGRNDAYWKKLQKYGLMYYRSHHSS